MELKCIRKIFTKRSTISKLFIDGVPETNVLEDCVREVVGEPVEKWKIPHVTAIPYGKYEVIIDFSNRFQENMLHILNVQGFEGIRIHSGNSALDTDGCLIVGDTQVNNDYIIGSRLALKRVFNKIQSALDEGDKVTIEIIKGA
jgi:hypothetical protein